MKIQLKKRGMKMKASRKELKIISAFANKKIY